MARLDANAFELAKVINRTNAMWNECRDKLDAWQFNQEQQDAIKHAYGQDIDLVWGRFVLGM